MERINTFEAYEEEMQSFNRKALLNLPVAFVFDDADQTLFTFPGYVSAYLKIYDERDGQLLKSFSTQLTRNSNVLVLNCSVSDMTFDEKGKRWYEMGYNSSGYEVPLRYGDWFVI